MKKQVRKKEIKEYNDLIETKYGLKELIDKKAKVEIEEGKFIYIDQELLFFFGELGICPTLKQLLKNNILPKVSIDMPAVPYMIKGADVMRPGIKTLENFKKDDYVAIVDETHKKPLAIAIALFSSDEIKNLEKGKVLKNIHFIGDDIWKK